MQGAPNDVQEAAAIAIPHEELSPQALRGVIESFVLREGTDYGEREIAFEHKVAQVMGQLERHEAQIVFDPVSQSIAILPSGGARLEGR